MPGFEIKTASGINRIIRPNTKAIKKFEAGPAKETFISPYFLSEKLWGFTGTGLAHPKSIGLCVINKSKGSMIDPKGSRCLRGFNVSLPSFLAVGSPKVKAV